MRRSLRRAISLCLFAAQFSANIASAGVMGSAGQFAVSPSGAATYSIPIRVAPGTAGIEPKLSLSYNSQAGNGHLGVGWSLDGLSMIERCARTVAQDGVKVGISYDANDRFCMGGKRLVVVSGTYGADGAEYRMEQNDFSKIVSYGAANNGPVWFKLWSKSGQIIEFGNTASARMGTQGGATVSGWAVNKLQDVKGNYLTVTYVNDIRNGEFYPQRIDYTGNANTGVAPDNSLQFQYESKQGLAPFFKQSNIAKLVKIQNVSQGVISEYRLAYETGPTTSRSRLQSVTECDAVGACLAPIKFSWDNTVVATKSMRWVAHSQTADDSGMIDLFGDGRVVNWMRSGSDYSATQLNADGTVREWHWKGPIVSADGGQWADLFGDGRPVFWTRSGDMHSAVRFNVDGTTQTWSWRRNGSGTVDSKLVDLFGDGRLVYWTRSGNTHFATRFNADGTAQNWQWTVYGSTEMDRGFVDLFGDGKLVYWTNSKTTHFASRLSADGTVQNWKWDAPVAGLYFWSIDDLFGDGRPVQNLYLDGKYWGMRLNPDGTVQTWAWTQPWLGGTMPANLFGDGRMFFLENPWGSKYFALQFNPDNTIQRWDWTGVVVGAGYGEMVDLFGDGREVYWSYARRNHSATQFNSDGTVRNWQWTVPEDGSFESVQLADIFGDGRKVLLAYSGTTYYATQLLQSTTDQLLGITTGLGATINIAYKPLTDSSVYTKDNTAVYPTTDVQDPTYVVSSVATSNGIGGTVSTNYAYGGLKNDLSGRMSQGFRWTRASQVETGISVLTEYRQDWPYTGMPFLVKKTLPGGGSGGVLSQMANYYNCMDFVGTPNCVAAPGRIYFPYLQQSTSFSWDLSGAALPSTRMTMQYDKWGNPTRIETVAADGHRTFTTVANNSFINNETNWLLGRLTRETVTKNTSLPAAGDPGVGVWTGNPGSTGHGVDSGTANPSSAGSFASNTAWVNTLPALLTAGQTLYISVQVKGTSKLSGHVTFADGAKILAIQSVDATGKASFSGALSTVGPRTITATYSGDEVHQPSSASAATTVKGIDMTPILMLLLD